MRQATRDVRFAAGSDQPVVLLLGQQVDRIDWNSPTIAFLAANRPNPQNHLTLQPGAWPESLPPDSMIIVQPEDQASVAELIHALPRWCFNHATRLAQQPNPLSLSSAVDQAIL